MLSDAEGNETYLTLTEVTRGEACRYGGSFSEENYTPDLPESQELLQIWATYDVVRLDNPNNMIQRALVPTPTTKDAEGFTQQATSEWLDCGSPNDNYESMETTTVPPGEKVRLYGVFSIPKTATSFTIGTKTYTF